MTKCTFLAFNKGVRTWRKASARKHFFEVSRSHEHEVNKDAMDEHPFIELVEQHEAAIGRVCRSFCSVAEDREDLRQEILLNLWRGWKAYRPDHKATSKSRLHLKRTRRYLKEKYRTTYFFRV